MRLRPFMQYVVSRSSLFNSKDCANGYFVACIRSEAIRGDPRRSEAIRGVAAPKVIIGHWEAESGISHKKITRAKVRLARRLLRCNYTRSSHERAAHADDILARLNIYQSEKRKARVAQLAIRWHAPRPEEATNYTLRPRT
jgi:hypothetical protein